MAEAVADEQEIKQRAVRRLIVAVILVLAAVGLLTYLSYYKPGKIVTKPIPENLPPPPPPIVSGPEPAPIEPAEPPTTLPEPPAANTAPDNTALPPPPKVVTKPLAPPGPGPKKTGVQEVEPRQTPQPLIKAAPKPAPAAATPATAPATPAVAATPAETTAAKAAPAYVVQFGVFSNTQNALQLVEKLKQIGIAARTETRVQLPAFKSKAEAEAALAKLKEKGIPATLVAH